jgi:phosphonate transport system permease protein
MRGRSIHKWGHYIGIVILVVVVYLSYRGLDFSGMSVSRDFLRPIIDGLADPDWEFVRVEYGEGLIDLLMVTIAIAFLGTFIGAFLAFPFSLLSANNLWKHRPIVPKLGKVLLNGLRAFPELIYAIVFVRVVGPGPFAGVLAIGVSQIGMMGKLFTEDMEALPKDSVEAMEAVGANFWQTMFYSRLPILNPAYISYILNHFEIAIRSAAVLGLVGAGGIGAPLIFAIQARNWPRVSIILIGVILLIFMIDTITGFVRKRLH